MPPSPIASTAPPADEHDTLQPIYQSVVQQVIAKKTDDQIRAALATDGIDAEAASVVIEDVRAMFKAAKARASLKNMLFGALWAVGGTVVTVVTYSAAVSKGGGGYVVAWGAVIFGAFQFFRGLLQRLSA